MASGGNSYEHGDGRVCRRAVDRLLGEKVIIDSAYLFADRKEVQIHHEGELYRLRVTKNGKLILNK